MVLTSPKRAHKRQNIRKKAKKAIREREGSSSSGDTTQEKAERREERRERSFKSVASPKKKQKQNEADVSSWGRCAPRQPKEKQKKNTIRYNLSILSIFILLCSRALSSAVIKRRGWLQTRYEEKRGKRWRMPRETTAGRWCVLFFFFSLPCFVFLCISWHSRWRHFLSSPGKSARCSFNRSMMLTGRTILLSFSLSFSW